MINYNFQNFGTRGIRNQLPPYLSGVIPEVGTLGLYPSLNQSFAYAFNALIRGQGTFAIPQGGGIIRIVQQFNAGTRAAYYPRFASALVSVCLNSDTTGYQGTKGFVPKLGGIEFTLWVAFRYIEGTTWVPVRYWLEQVTQVLDLINLQIPEYSVWDNVGLLPLVNNGLSPFNLPTSDAFITVATEVPILCDVSLLTYILNTPTVDS